MLGYDEKYFLQEATCGLSSQGTPGEPGKPGQDGKPVSVNYCLRKKLYVRSLSLGDCMFLLEAAGDSHSVYIALHICLLKHFTKLSVTTSCTGLTF